MLWLILSVSLVNLVALAGVAWHLLRQLQRDQQRLLAAIEMRNQDAPPPSSMISSLLEAGASFVPSDQEAAAVEARMLADSAQRAGSLRSRRSSTRTRG